MNIVILGAGLSGLTTAYYLKKHYPDISLSLIEGKSRPGGHIQTLRKDQFLFEQGPQGIRPKGKGQDVLDLIHELNLFNQLIFSNGQAKKRYIYHDHHLEPVPQSLTQALRSPLTKGLIGALLKDLCIKKQNRQDESVASFVERHFGKRFADNLFDPLVTGIWAADIQRLSVRSAFPQFCRWEEEKGSVLRGLIASRKKNKQERRYPKDLLNHPLFSLKNGLQTLTDALSFAVDDHLILDTQIQRIEHVNNQYHLYDHRDICIAKADKVISTLPAYALAPIISNMTPRLSSLLAGIPYIPIATIGLGFDTSFSSLQGFGYLVPSQERQDILGVIFNHQIFPERYVPDTSAFTVMIGGAHSKNFHLLKPYELERKAIEALRSHLQIMKDPIVVTSKLIKSALPHFNVGHLDRQAMIQELSPHHFHVSGNFMSGVAITDIVHQSQNLVRHIRPGIQEKAPEKQTIR